MVLSSDPFILKNEVGQWVLAMRCDNSRESGVFRSSQPYL